MEFSTLISHVQEDSKHLKVDLTKNGENHEEIVVLVTPITYNEYFTLRKSPLPLEFDGVALPDPAECECMYVNCAAAMLCMCIYAV